MVSERLKGEEQFHSILRTAFWRCLIPMAETV